MKHVLMQAQHEIQQLRRRNEVLQAQVDVVAAFSAALFGPPRPQGQTIDIVYSLQREIDKLEGKTHDPQG